MSSKQTLSDVTQSYTAVEGSWAISSPECCTHGPFSGRSRSLGIWGFQHKMRALALQSSTVQVDKLEEHDSVESEITEGQWILLKETGRKGGVDPENKKHKAAFPCVFLYHVSNPVRVPHLQRILHQAKRNKQNIPRCGFSESEVMNQNQLKGNQICSGKQWSLWLWEHRQRWPQRDQTISFPSGIPFCNCLEPRYLRATANCSGVQLFLRWPEDFESQNLNKHL